MENYRRIMYIENLQDNRIDEPATKSLAVCLNNKDTGRIKKMEYYFCDDIHNKINRKLITQHGADETAILNLAKRWKMIGPVGYLVVEADKEAEEYFDKQLKAGEGIEKIILH